MSPAARRLIDQTNEDFAAFDWLEIDDDWPQILRVFAGDAVENFVVIGGDNLDPRLPASAATDKKAGPRMGHFEPLARQRPDRLIAKLFIAANPILPRVF